MKKKLSVLFSFFLLNAAVHAQDLVTSVEAETGVLTGNVKVATQTSNSSGGYVYGLQDGTDKFTITVNMTAGGYYDLGIVYRGANGDKWQDVFVNGTFYGNVSFPASTNFVETAAGAIFLNAGANTLTVQKSWGYTDIDKFNFYSAPPKTYNISPNLTDPLATEATKKLYAFMVSQFGKKIISGQTDGYYDSIKALTGKSPLLKDFDMQPYSPMYSYNWANGGFAFGPVASPNVQNAIDFYNNSGKRGIVDFQWHWHSPSGGTVGTNTFYTEYTTFDVTKAVTPGTQEHTDVLRDLDAIAVQLKKLSDAGVPLIWRPMHEVGGTWFWWSAKGPAASKALWNIIYDRIANYHGLHNLIWAWNGNDINWYPGNDKADLIGIDSYPGAYNYTINKGEYDKAYTITAGQKIIALTENGPIPNINDAFAYGTPWSFFMSWYDLVFKENTRQHVIDVYANPLVLTLENVDAVLPIILSGFNVKPLGNKAMIEWNTSSEQNNDRFEIERSSDGINFYKVATVKGIGNSATGRRYIAYDDNPSSGTNFYRLVQYNFDGRKTDHGIKTANFKTAADITVKAYPNPSRNNLGIQLNNFKGKTVTVTLIDLSGKAVYRQIISTPNGQGFYKLNTTPAVAKGQYFLNVAGEGLQQSLKVILK